MAQAVGVQLHCGLLSSLFVQAVQTPDQRSVSRSHARVKNRCTFPLSCTWLITPFHVGSKRESRLSHFADGAPQARSRSELALSAHLSGRRRRKMGSGPPCWSVLFLQTRQVASLQTLPQSRPCRLQSPCFS